MSETKSKKQKKRDVCEENISKLNLDEKQARKIARVPTGKIKQFVRIKNKYCIYLRLKEFKILYQK